MQPVIADSICAFGREEWNRLFADELEDWDYYLAVERAGLAGFSWVYFGVREDDRLLAAVPGFVTDYRLDTTVTGKLWHVTNAVSRAFPRLLTLRMLALGSPVAEVCHLGFAPELDGEQKQRLLGTILAWAESHAQANRVRLLAVKDAGDEQDQLWSAAARATRLRRQPGLPTATLDIRFDSIDEYLGSLGRVTRRDLRRKLRSASALRVEWRHTIDDVVADILRLYRSTRSNAEYQFEDLTPDYFSGVLRTLGDRAVCALYWRDGRLVAFNLLLHDGKRLIDKFLGMDSEVVREYNLYFVSWIENVRYCIEHDIAVYQSGQGLHREKIRLGSRLSPNWLWYRHRNVALDSMLALLERLARLDRLDPELAALIRSRRQ